MKYRNLGTAGVKVSTLCLGAMTFGEADEKSFMHKAGSDEQTTFSVLDRALAAGVNFIDTADVYGQDGLSERVLGNWIVARGSRNRRCNSRMDLETSTSSAARRPGRTSDRYFRSTRSRTCTQSRAVSGSSRNRNA